MKTLLTLLWNMISLLFYLHRRGEQGLLVSKTRSPQWSEVRRHHLEYQSKCQACWGTDHLQVHHIKSFSTHPELELDPNNLITLCEAPSRNCHLTWGHLYDWHNINPFVVEDLAFWRAEIDRSTKRSLIPKDAEGGSALST